jgi:hypothetical protein
MLVLDNDYLTQHLQLLQDQCGTCGPHCGPAVPRSMRADLHCLPNILLIWLQAR